MQHIQQRQLCVNTELQSIATRGRSPSSLFITKTGKYRFHVHIEEDWIPQICKTIKCGSPVLQRALTRPYTRKYQVRKHLKNRDLVLRIPIALIKRKVISCNKSTCWNHGLVLDHWSVLNWFPLLISYQVNGQKLKDSTALLCTYKSY